jgi:excinuclease UvrABC nuclease subunit
MKEQEIIQKMFKRLINSTSVNFPNYGKVNITNKQGVYIIFSPDEKVLHVGKTNRAKNGLNQRLQNHLYNSSSFSIQYLKHNGKLLRQGYKFKYLEVDESRKRALLEALAIGLLSPAHIGTGEKK